MRQSQHILILGIVLGLTRSGIAEGQQRQAAPVTLVCSESEPNPCSTVTEGLREGATERTAYVSTVHAAALRGITFPDSVARRSFEEVLFHQIDEIWWTADRQARQTLADTAANDTLRNDLFARLLPELRALLPTDQQGIFDRNVRALRESPEPLTIIPTNGYQEGIRQSYMDFIAQAPLRGVSLVEADPKEVSKVLKRQATEVALKSGKGTKVVDGGYDNEARRNQKALADQRLPELRARIPAGQQALFDQNVKALRESDYTIMLDLRADPLRSADEMPASYLIGCMDGCR